MHAGTCRICELLDAWIAWLYDKLKPSKKKVEVVQLEPIPLQPLSKPTLQLPLPDVAEFREHPIVDVCALLGITLDKEGRGMCPLCNHPSPTAFVVTERLGRFWCSGHCQNGGDTLELVAQLRQMSKPEAAHWLLEQLGPP